MNDPPAAALSDFEFLVFGARFFAENRTGFESIFNEYEAKGEDPKAAMCFVWHVEAKEG